ncbi:MAG: Dabb family protein [Muribaculaceae bacterium]|nr:Dabb family protein [Muribaculaceae bacterium]MDE7081008.1 Dabb family protein [Muribaculaceae bacterium]
MVKHIVTFKLNGDPQTRQRVANEFATALMALPEKIDCLTSMEVGINSNPAEDWDLVLTAIVGTMDEVAVYANHPDHLAAAAIVAPYKAARACVDYYCD